MSARDVAEMALKIRSLLPDAVDECAEIRVFGKRLADILSLPRGGSSFWFGPLAEKNPLKTREFTWLAQALAGIKPSGRPRWALADLFRALAAVVQIAVRGVIARRVVGPPPRDFADGFRPIAVTYFPYVDRAAARSGNFVNRYFAPVQHMRQMDWVLMFVKADGYGFLGAVRLAKRFADNGERLVFLEAFLSLSQCWLMFKYVILSTVMYLSSRGHVRENMPAPSPEWRPILTALVRRSFFGVEASRTHAAWVAFTGIFANCVSDDAKCVYLAEMQSWEAALNLAAKSEGMKTFGYQHSVTARHPMLWRHGPAQMREMPLPGAVLCDSEREQTELLAMGYADVRLVEALRLEPKPVMDPGASADLRKSLLVVGSIIPEETDGLLRLVRDTAPFLDSWRIGIKPHPSYRVRHVPVGCEIVDRPFPQALSGYGTILVATSSVAAEALAHGRDVLVASFDSFFGLDVLESHGRMYRRVRDADGLVGFLKRNGPHRWYAPAEMGKKFAESFWHWDRGLPKWRKILEG